MDWIIMSVLLHLKTTCCLDSYSTKTEGVTLRASVMQHTLQLRSTKSNSQSHWAWCFPSNFNY